MKTESRRIPRTMAMCGAAGLALAMNYVPPAGAEPYCKLHSTATRVAVIELYSEVRAGENRGKVLRHDFVVREMSGP